MSHVLHCLFLNAQSSFGFDLLFSSGIPGQSAREGMYFRGGVSKFFHLIIAVNEIHLSLCEWIES